MNDNRTFLDVDTKSALLDYSFTASSLAAETSDNCPEVMTEQELIRFLRLDLVNIKNPSDTLAYYRRKGLLRGTQIGKCVRYRRIEIERFLQLITEQNPR